MALIYRQAALDKFKPWLKVKGYSEGELNMLRAVIYELENLPSVQPERIKGHWIEITSRNHTYKCSVCGRLLVNITDGKNNVAKNYPYCHCGADMREEKTDGKRCKGCPHSDVIRAQDGFTFLGCRHSPYNGKMVAEIKKCPMETKKMEVEKSKGFIRVSDALYDLYGKDPRRLWSFQDIEKWLRSLRPVDISYLENAANTKEDGWLERNKDRILQAGLEGREVEFRIGGRLFAIREKAQ